MNISAFRICFVAILLAFTVVVVGAFTRLVDAGLGCPDWPTCYGHLWVPLSEADVVIANAKFAETPVEHDKTWPEQLHRIIASVLGLIILGIFYLCYRKEQAHRGSKSVLVLLGLLLAGTIARIFLGDGADPYLWVLVAVFFLNLARLTTYGNATGTPFKLPSAIAGLVILQGLFGMWTVTLNLWPQVVTLHLLGGFATLSLLWLLMQRLGQWHWRASADIAVKFLSLKTFALVVLAIVSVQVALGGWLSSNYAALACPDFPLCQNQVWPHASFVKGFNFLQDIGPNYLGGLMESEARIAIHFSHRLGALVVLIVTAIFAVKLWLTGFPQARNLAIILLGVLALQFALGILNIVLSLPLAIALAHNAVGAILLLTIVTINHRLGTVKKH